MERVGLAYCWEWISGQYPHFKHLIYVFTFTVSIYQHLRTPPPGLQKKHLLVQSRVKRTAFSDKNYFINEYISNFFNMNDFFLVLYQVLDNLSFLDLQFNYTSRLNRANFLSFSEKKGDTERFFKRQKFAQFRIVVW